jgi:hypothetical protein|tara:strand:- start:2735 stop:3130 length:396 start_codon:yes stop_codon:yes gene_type:complete
MNKFLVTVSLIFSISVAASAEVFIISPKDGEEVSSPVEVIFGLQGMGIAPAGINFPNTGHHHLLIDLDQLPDLKSGIPADAQHLHFGKGQTQALIELDPGEHSLQLLLGDWMHVPHETPVVSEKIKILVLD